METLQLVFIDERTNRIQRLFKLLDAKIPNWRDAINLNKLDFGCPFWSLERQISQYCFGINNPWEGVSHVLEVLGITSLEEEVFYGINCNAGENYDELTESFKRELERYDNARS